MNSQSHDCPKCQRKMEQGHLPDVAHGAVMLGTWSPGLAVVRKYIGGIKYDKRIQMPLIAYRCSRCGYVELFAGEP